MPKLVSKIRNSTPLGKMIGRPSSTAPRPRSRSISGAPASTRPSSTALRKLRSAQSLRKQKGTLAGFSMERARNRAKMAQMRRSGRA